jgi:hypothetical protein
VLPVERVELSESTGNFGAAYPEKYCQMWKGTRQEAIRYATYVDHRVFKVPDVERCTLVPLQSLQ